MHYTQGHPQIHRQMDIQDHRRLYCDGQERVEATAYHGQCLHGTEDDRQDDKGQNTEIIH